MITLFVEKEAFVDPSRDESIVFELLDLKDEVGDEGSAGWFLRDLAAEQDAEGSMVRDLVHVEEFSSSLCSLSLECFLPFPPMADFQWKFLIITTYYPFCKFISCQERLC